MIDLRPVGELHLATPAEPGGPRHLTAASGLVVVGERIWVVSDEEVALAEFRLGDTNSGRLLPLGADDLPREPAARKEAKPDLEALCMLPSAPHWPTGALLAIGSGATEQRERGWLCPLAADGSGPADPAEISLAGLHAALRPDLPDLNLEGAAVTGDRLWLAQRGNGADGANALVALELEAALHALVTDRALPDDPLCIVPYELGEVDGVALTFSDLAPLSGGRVAYCAVAEAGGSTYHDGACVGAAIGTLVPGEKLEGDPVPLSEPHKVEGLADAGEGRLLLVADPDDPSRPSPLFEARLG